MRYNQLRILIFLPYKILRIVAAETRKIAKKNIVAIGQQIHGNGHTVLAVEALNGKEEKKNPEKVVKKKTAVKTALDKSSADLSKNTAVKKVTVKKEKPAAKQTHIHITLMLRFHTSYGQMLYITGNHEMFGSNRIEEAKTLQYLTDDLWTITIKIDRTKFPAGGIFYNYILKNKDGSVSYDWGNDKKLDAKTLVSDETLLIDSWNHPGYYENSFYTEPFQEVLLKQNETKAKTATAKKHTHLFRVKSPLLPKGYTLCLLGNTKEMGEWNEAKPVIMWKDDVFYTAKLDLGNVDFPVSYKYGVWDVANKQFVRYEDGKDRLLYDAFVDVKNTIVNDGFAVLPATGWKGAGIAIPVFSLKSENSCGTGEFTDLKLLVDWAKKVGLKLIQILPVNDTTAVHSWKDSYPYAAISAFALHPMYVNLEKLAGSENHKILKGINKEKLRLNAMTDLDYEGVNTLKWSVIRQLYDEQHEEMFASGAYKEFFEVNKHWLVPYAVFCKLRDKYGSAEFSKWPAYNEYKVSEAEALIESGSEKFDKVAIHFYVQFHLHLQLKEATEYAHANGIIVKGDIPIGIYRNGSDAWQHPELYHMEMQAGAPPDDFAIKGQNWGFPTYNWQKMREDGFAWWKQRFEQMSLYFDAFRIDHVLGFFRIWSIPMHAVEGIMGRFQPAIAIHIKEFAEKGTWFDYSRYCRPYITEEIISKVFGEQAHFVKTTFLDYDDYEKYKMKVQFDTQRKVEAHFELLEDTELNTWLRNELYSLISNVILFEEENSNGEKYHFRFGIEGTTSFQYLDTHTQHQLKDLYINYFFRRQDDHWMHEAMQKLPALKRVTNMLICGEDLGLVPACVPDVMKQLGILSLEIQRMPKDPEREFFHPNDAPYLSVVTPSTHDMSTIRGWWEEDRTRTQKFFNNEMGEWGEAPYFCSAWVNKAIILQHLHSPAMWSIFQLQDVLGISDQLRRENPHEERINIPANAKHYWKYRMHLTMEQLLLKDDFNTELLGFMKTCGRV